MTGSAWDRDFRGTFSATRGDGVSLLLGVIEAGRAQFAAMRDGDVFFEFTLPGDDPSEVGNAAIDFVDMHHVPEGWTYDAATRSFAIGDWRVSPTPDGHWRAVKGGKPVGRAYDYADRARAYVEARMGLARTRGPKARDGEAATATLPDVRATAEEAALARETARLLGTDYSSLARALLHSVRRMTVVERTHAVIRYQDSGRVDIVPVKRVVGEAGSWTVDGEPVDMLFHPHRRLVVTASA